MVKAWVRFIFGFLLSPQWRCAGCGEILRTKQAYVAYNGGRPEAYCADCCNEGG